MFPIYFIYSKFIKHVSDECYKCQDTKRQKKTLKKTRKFMVDGVEVSVTTSKIITDNDTKNQEMRFLRYRHRFPPHRGQTHGLGPNLRAEADCQS